MRQLIGRTPWFVLWLVTSAVIYGGAYVALLFTLNGPTFTADTVLSGACRAIASFATWFYASYGAIATMIVHDNYRYPQRFY